MKRFLALFLSAIMIATSIPAGCITVSATGMTDVVENDTQESNESLIEESDGIEEDIITDNQEFYDQIQEDSQEGIQESQDSIDIEATEEPGIELTPEEQTAKANMTLDTLTIASAEEGEDYVKDEVIYPCDSLEAAELVAEAYSLETGFEVTVDSFAYGIAVLTVEKQSSNSSISASSVETMLQIASDPNISLPAVYANYSRELYSANEHFADPFLQEDNEYYQWYHNIIDDKFVWNEIESGRINPRQVTVAVIDTGINSNHSEFDGVNIKCLEFTSSKAGVTLSGDNDTRGHGTNVSGIIAAAGNSEGGRGIAAGVNILSLKVFPDSNESRQTAEDADIVRALNYVYNSGKPLAKVINMSLGSTQFNGIYNEVIARLNSSGVTIIVAAGNSNTTLDTYPAAFEHVIAVAALNRSKAKASYSNYGRYVDIAAPGGDVVSSRNAVGFTDKQYIWGPGITGAYDGQINYQGDNYLPMVGTSQAAPVVSAVAALVYAQNPSIKPFQVESILEQTATPVKGAYSIGAGCVNAAAALDIASTVSEPVIINNIGELESGLIDSGTKLSFQPIKDASIYYSVDGKNPDPTKAQAGKPTIIGKKSSGTYIYDSNDPLVLEGIGQITIKAVAKQYDKLSPVKSYSYTYNKALVKSIELSSVDSAKSGDKYQLSIGKKVSLKAAVEPNYAANKALEWYSSDPDIASVDSRGNITGRSEGIATITASAKDGSSVSAEAIVKVLPLTTSISIDELYKSIDMVAGESLVLPRGSIQIDPEEGSYIFSSSKPKVAAVDAMTGKIEALSSGAAVITIMAGDGSKVKTTITVKVKTLVSSINITDSKGINKVAEGKKITPKVVFNEGNNKPDNSKLEWSIVTGSDYATVDPKSGTVTAKTKIISYPYNSKTVRVKAIATDDSDTEGYWDIEVYPITTSISAYPRTCQYYVDQADSMINGTNISIYTTPGINRIIGLSYKSSNPNVVAIDENGYFRCLKKGKAKITITANDGSGKKAVVSINVKENIDVTGWGVESPMERNVLYPGKSLSFKIVGTSIPSIYRKNIQVVGINDSGYTYAKDKDINVKGLKVTATSDAKDVRPGTVKTLGGQIKSFIYFSGRRFYYTDPIDLNKTYVELYPVGTSSISVDKDIYLKVGDKQRLRPTSTPENACQKYYSFTSSNPKVAKVDSTGTIVAVSKGTAKITVTAGDGSGKKAVTTVQVVTPVSTLSISTKSGYNTVAAE